MLLVSKKIKKVLLVHWGQKCWINGRMLPEEDLVQPEEEEEEEGEAVVQEEEELVRR